MLMAAGAPATRSTHQGRSPRRSSPFRSHGRIRPGRTSVTAEEKAKLIAGVSQLLRDVLHKPFDSTFVVIQEVELENWGRGGLPVSEFRKQRSPG
jgi:4-oxalocrotonate tautomerase